MERLAEVLKARRAGAIAYGELLADVKTVRPPYVPAGYTHVFQSFVVLYTAGQEPDLANLGRLNQERNRLMAAMEKDGIQVRQGTHAVHTLGYYAQKYGLKAEDFPKSLLADRLSITLPLFPGITQEQQERVVSYLRRPERYITCAA
jgi:dTDP-4-amino-4,6-dideoxygalactose transaminase